MSVEPESRTKDRTLRLYFLGGLSEPEQTRIEERMFADEAFYRQLCLVEDELIDAYVRDRLPALERARFEDQFLASPRRRARVEFARVFRDPVIDRVRGTEKARWRGWWATLVNWLPDWSSTPWVGTAAAVLMVGVAIFLYAQWDRTREEAVTNVQHRREDALRREPLSPEKRANPSEHDSRLAQLQAKLEQTEADRHRLQRELGRQRSAQPVLLSFVLSPGLLRDENGLKQLRIPHAGGVVQFELELEDEKPGPYRAMLQTIDGVETWSQGGLAFRQSRQPRSVRVQLPASLLRPEDYKLVLSRRLGSGGWEDACEYFFRVRSW